MANKIVYNIETNTDLDSVDKQINDIIESTDGLTKQYKELRKAAQEATDPEEFRKLAKAAGELKDRIDDTNRSINNFASDTQKLDVVVGSIQGIAGAFSAVQGTMALLGAENEDLEKTLVKVQGSLAVLNGVQQVANTLNKDSAVGSALYAASNKILAAAIGTSTGALKAFRLALVATGVGALVVGLGLLIANFDKVKQVVNDSVERFNNLGEGVKTFISIIFPLIGILRLVVAGLEQLGIIDDAETRKAGAAADKRIEKSKESAKQIEKEIEVLRAKGKSEEEIFKLTDKLLSDQIAAYENSVKVKGKLNAQEQEDYEKLLQNKAVFDANYEKFRQDEAERTAAKIKEVRDRAAQIFFKDEERRIGLIRNNIERELKLIDLKYKRERREAIKSGADITLINKQEERERRTFIESQQKELGSVILKAFKSVNDDLKRLNLTTYAEDLEEFKKTQAEKKRISDEDRIKITDDIITLLKKTEGASRAQIKSLKRSNEELKSLYKDNNTELENLIKNLEIIDKTQKQSLMVEGRELELLKLKSITEGLGFVISLEEKINDLQTIGGDKAIETIKKETGFAESLSQLKIRLIIRESEERALQEAKTLEAISIAGDKEIFQRLKNNEILFNDLTKKQKRYSEEIEKINSDETLSAEERRLRITGLEKKFLEEGLNFRTKYFRELNKLKQQSLISETKINDSFLALERNNLTEQLSAEEEFLKAKGLLLKADFKNERDRLKAIDDLNAKFVSEQLKREIKLKEDKLGVLEEELKVNPNINPELRAKIGKEILELQNKLAENEIKIAEASKVNLSEIFQQFARELELAADQILSSTSQLLSATAEENRKLLEQGKINEAENEKRQKKLFEQQKNIEISRTIISTISSAQQAYQSQFLPAPDPSSPIRGAIAAAAALASGLLRVAAIRKQTFSSGQSLSSSGGVSNSPSLGSGRVVANQSGSTVMEPTKRDDFDTAIRVFVLEGDITESQRRVRIIRGGANATF